jgi:hypothetical protein
MEGFSMSGLRRTAIDLFTADEHAVLARWFDQAPPDFAKHIVPQEAARQLGFAKQPDHYRLIDAAAAFVVLERVERFLPQWAVENDGKLILGRRYRHDTKFPNRTVLLQPRHLFTINWADSAHGFSWPVAYYVTWIPYYDRFVVTSSADCPDMFGYCDFALGAFGIDKPIKQGAGGIICADWTCHSESEQPRWVCLLDVGFISGSEVCAWATRSGLAKTTRSMRKVKLKRRCSVTYGAVGLIRQQKSIVLEELPRFNLQALCDPGNVVDRYIPLSPFDRTQVGPVDPAIIGQGFLRKSPCSAYPAHVFSQDIPQRAFVRPFHGRRYCRLVLLRRTLLSYIQQRAFG